MGFLIQLVLGQCMAGLGFMGLWQIQATLTVPAQGCNPCEGQLDIQVL